MPIASAEDRNEFLRSMRNGVLIGAQGLLLALPWLRSGKAAPIARPAAPVSSPALAKAPGPLAEFGDETPSAEARHVANWAFSTDDHQGKSVVILDKKAARAYTFDPEGRLLAATPALLGSAIGDEAVAGIGDKPLAQIRPEEKTTHAGCFQAQPGLNAEGEGVIWIDYDAALSMHRVRATVPAERRLERLATPSEADNRISFGCVNLPVHVYEQVLGPAVKKSGAIVYVLPETRTPQEVLGSWDVTDPAQTHQAHAVRAMRSAPAGASPARRYRDQ